MMDLFSLEAEQGLLGCIMLDCSLMERVSFLNSSDFYARHHREIYRSAKEMSDKGVRFDGLSLFESMDQQTSDDIGGYAYIVELCKNVISNHMVVSYADAIKDFSIKRKCVKDLECAIKEISAKGSNAIESISHASKKIDDHLISASKSDSIGVEDLIDKTLEEMNENLNGMRIGLSSGVKEIDDRLGYKMLAFGEITVYGALSKNGKTKFSNTTLARCDLLENETAHVFSIEMSEISMFNAVISAKTGLPENFYARPNFYSDLPSCDFEQMMARWGVAATELKEKNNITIDGAKDVDIDYIVAGIRKQYTISRSEGKRLRLVMIDHWHRMNFGASGDGRAITYQMRDAARKLKNIASELEIAVVVLAQLNNKAEDQDPTSFHILDTSALRHEMQAFVGFRIYKQDGGVYFSVHGDSQRYGDMYTRTEKAYVKLVGGVVRSLDDGEKFVPKSKDELGH